MTMRCVERATGWRRNRPESAAPPRTASGGRRTLAAAFAALLLGAALPGAGLAAPAAEPISFSETYSDWRVNCGVAEQGAGDAAAKKAKKKPPARSCILQQRIDWKDENTGRQHRLLIVTLGPPAADGEMALTMLTPFGLLLDRGVRLRVDKGKSFALRFRTCLAQGCVVRGRLDGKKTRQLRKGKILNVETVEAAGETVFRVPVSLKGFTAAYRRLRAAVR